MGRKINLNTAGKDELDQIPGIGKNCAEELMRYREEHGGIKSMDELNDIPGFGDKAIQHLRENAEL